MAGAGYKLFNTGDVLTAAQVNTYLQQQVIMVFADSSARTTALSGVVSEGMFTYLTGTNAFEYYDGAAWQSASNPGDITAVTAGTGLSGGGTSGAVTLSTDATIPVGYSTTATAAGTTTLTAASNSVQYFTGTTTQTIVLPVASTMVDGEAFIIHNNSTGALTVNSSGANLVVSIPAATTFICTCILTSGTTAASWDADYTGSTTVTGTGANVLATSPTITPAVGTTATATTGAGFMGMPQNATTTGAYTLTAADAGTHIYSTATRTITIPANGTTAFPIGTTIAFINATGTTLTLSITTDTLLLANAGTTGSRTLAAFGFATCVKITSTSWIVSGNGLT
jgi:hypothetical protein